MNSTHPHLPPQNVLGLIIMKHTEYIFRYMYWRVILFVHFSIYVYMREFMHTHAITSVVGKHWGIWHQNCEIHSLVASTTPSLSGVIQWILQLTMSHFWMQNTGRRDWSRCKFENSYSCGKKSGNISILEEEEFNAKGKVEALVKASITGFTNSLESEKVREEEDRRSCTKNKIQSLKKNLRSYQRETQKKEDFNKSVKDGKEPERAVGFKKKKNQWRSSGVCWQREVQS